MVTDFKVRIMSGNFIGMGGNLKISFKKSIPYSKQSDVVESAISHYASWVKTPRSEIWPRPAELQTILNEMDGTPRKGDAQTSLF